MTRTLSNWLLMRRSQEQPIYFFDILQCLKKLHSNFFKHCKIHLVWPAPARTADTLFGGVCGDREAISTNTTKWRMLIFQSS
jgi:hypothetical protein